VHCIAEKMNTFFVGIYDADVYGTD